MKPSSVLDPSFRSLHAAALILGAVALTATSAVASTAANTVITNTATVNYNDAGGAAQPAVSATAAVTVTLVPSAVTLSSPAAQIIAQGSSATLTYTITSTANGQDTYNLASVATPTNDSAVTPTLAASIALGGTTLAVVANVGDLAITVPYDNTGGTAVNGIGPGSVIVIGGNPYTVAAAGVTKNVAANTATITLTGAIAVIGQAGTVVGERKTFTETVPSGTVTSGSSGSQSVATTATSATAPNPTTMQATATVITVQRPTLTVTKVVSTDGGASFNPTGSAPPGTVLIYKITASNTGSTSASSVAFSDVLPAYLTYQAGTGKFATLTSTAYSAATALTDNVGGYTVGSTVAYNPGGATGTVGGGSVLILFFGAKIN